MKESIGLTFTINIMIVFIVVSFVFVAGILSYTKAFKAGSLIIKSLEKYEGYNELAFDQINRNLGVESLRVISCFWVVLFHCIKKT